MKTNRNERVIWGEGGGLNLASLKCAFLARALDAPTPNLGGKGNRMPFGRSVETLSYVRALRSIHLFSPLLEGSKFHAYLTAEAQNAVPRIFAF